MASDKEKDSTVAAPSADISNPWFLSPSENPSLVLVTPVLSSDENYHPWARAMEMALTSKNKFDFINRTIEKHTKNDKKLAGWKRCNTLVLSWITHSVSPAITRSILWIDKAANVWKDLRDRFSQGNLFRIVELQEKIFAYRQGELSVSNYYTNLKVYIDELTQFRPITNCTCNTKCSCETLKLVKANQEADYIIRFLKWLNPCYSTVTTRVMLMDPGVLHGHSTRETVGLNIPSCRVECLSSTRGTPRKLQEYWQGNRPKCKKIGLLDIFLPSCHWWLTKFIG